MRIFDTVAVGPKRIVKNAVLIVEIVFLIVFGWFCIRLGIETMKRHKENCIDARALYSVVAEAEANIKEDPEFVNPATEQAPIAEIPDKYYSYVESARGYGRAYVIIYQDGTLDAFFGSRSFNLEYYSKYIDD